LRFICQLEEWSDKDNDNYRCASIAHIICSNKCGTVIALATPSNVFANLLKRIENMAEVEGIKEESIAGPASLRLPNRTGTLPMANSNPTKRIRVTLKQPDTARQELATAIH